jgi:DNA-directed RNA polymerase subunit RPC12/RpoP
MWLVGVGGIDYSAAIGCNPRQDEGNTMADISFSCPHCNQHLEAPPEMAGTDLECPSCNKQITVPKPVLRSRPGGALAAPAAPRPTPPAASAPAPAASPVTRAAAASKCPSCGAAAEADTVLCIQCGYHFKKKKQLSTAEGSAAAKSGGGGTAPKNVPAIAGLILLIVFAIGFIIYRMLG